MPRQREEKEKNTFLILGLLRVLCVHATGGVESKFDAGRVIDHDNSASSLSGEEVLMCQCACGLPIQVNNRSVNCGILEKLQL